jgi:hypothetical protein
MAEIDQPRFHNDAISTSSAGVNVEVDPWHPDSKAAVELSSGCVGGLRQTTS